MRRLLILTGLLLLGTAGFATEEVEPLDGDFLEYLANLEGDEDDWTLLADAQDQQTSPSKTDSKASKATKEPPKQPAKPAVDER